MARGRRLPWSWCRPAWRNATPGTPASPSSPTNQMTPTRSSWKLQKLACGFR
ncbi:hypothetical protein E2C01_067139 [Portunus trituberculatus]|uniref:Uncharacterized protein n=1 Tax=Portunus trituberculatus TaxID=210409 RepID=A0A5B7HSU7_PORTR|nr:hypothetical protein [Portunus trituberculatus]